jgi:hypothetical protein
MLKVKLNLTRYCCDTEHCAKNRQFPGIREPKLVISIKLANLINNEVCIVFIMFAEK